MVQILPEVPSFGTLLSRNLGAGISQGLGAATELIGKTLPERIKAQEINKLLSRGKQDSFSNKNNHSNISNENSSKIQSNEPFSPEDIAQISASYPEVASVLESQRKQARKEFSEERKYAQEETKPLREEMRNLQGEALNTEHSLELIESAMEGTGSWEGFADFLADSTGLENFRTRKGAELRSGIKNYFLGDLSRIKGGRPNQLIENQLLDAYQKMGRDPISNQKILVGQKSKNKLNNEKIRLFNELEDQYLSKGEHLPPNTEYIVNKKMKPIAERIEKDMIRDLERLNKLSSVGYKKLKSQLSKNEVLMFSPEGKAHAVDREEMKDYENQGWTRI